ncbi:WS/DGAT/MGAT family O-acyltransferase [Patulibacter defluvii]|uniref:WS/DGAT/MGAT family O-acyltransferase n=1 Tax=Patulibacter defluvii TaxID=3095358 RepID=UPI002A7576B8|nr:wax ester/triacylglycerol synthase family O-acyltransferase [Patulibacter sp. DM4]
MRQLTSLDALFLAHEGDRTVGHVSAYVVLDPSDAPGGQVTIEALRDMMHSRMPLLPPFRWKLVGVPLGIDHGYWATDPDFDLGYHVRETAVPAPGGDREVATLVGRLFSQPLDRERPLWELYLIQGLADGRCALFSKVHHALVDGVSGAEILGALFDLSPEGRTVEAPTGTELEHPPSQLEMLLRGVAATPKRLRRQATALPRLVANAGAIPGSGWVPGLRTAGRVARAIARPLTGDDRPLLEPPTGSAPEVPFSRRLSGHLRMAHVRLDLEQVKAVKAALGTTVNDVIMAVAAGGVRHWLAAHEALPEEPLLALVPVSVRTPEQYGTFGNRVGGMVVPLPTNLREPDERLAAARAAMQTAKERHRAVPADTLIDATRFLPPALFAQATKITLGIAGRPGVRPPMNLIVSNVPGPQVPLYCAGARIEQVVPVSPVTHGVGMNITVMSYLGRIDAGIVVDRDQVPDPELVAEGMERELAALRALAGIGSNGGG